MTAWRPPTCCCWAAGAEAAPLPPGLRRLDAVPPAPRAAAAAVLRLRREGYTRAFVVWPSLRTSAVRGALLALPAVVGAREVEVVDVPPDAGAPTTWRPPAWRRAADAAAFAGATLASGALAAGAGAALGLLTRRAPRPPRPLPPDGGALYLRTDLDLVGTASTAGGAAAHTAGIVGALQRRGRVVFGATGDVAGVDPALERVSLPTLAPANVTREVAELLSGLLQAAALLRRRPAGVDLVYQRYSLNNLAGLLAARRWGVPLVLEANASEAGWRRHWGSLRLGRLADASERLLLSRADRIAAVSEVVARDVVAAGADRERVVVAPNAADWAAFADATPAPLPFPPDAFVVAFAGSFYPWHGTPFLAEAFVELVAARPQARLLLVGDGSTRAETLAVLARAGVLEAVHATGLVPRGDVPALLAAADVVVSPHAEWQDFIGSPVKVFEYMASGRAILATRVGQMAHVLRDRQTALLVAPSDAGALRDALLELHDDAALRARLGQAAQDEARAEHSWDARLRTILGAPADGS